MLEIDGRAVAVSGWRGTVGHNWAGDRELTLSSSRSACEYGTRQAMPRIMPQPLPEG
jgi:hypothetical protein